MTTASHSADLWLNPRSLQSRVGASTWAKAQQLFLQNRVLALAIEPLTKYGLGRWQVTGKVKGSLARPYEVSCTVYLDNDGELRQWESDCTCPVGLRCKHAVALLLKAAYQGHELVAHHLPQNAATALPAASPAWVKTTSSRPVPSATAGAARPLSSPNTSGSASSNSNSNSNSLEAVLRDLISTGEALMSRANQLRERELAAAPTPPSDAQLLAWLLALEHASPVAATAAPTTALAPAALQPASPPEYPLYLLSVQNVNAQPVLHLELTSAYRKVKSGDWSKPKKVRREPQSGQPLYDQASATDRHVFQLLRALQKPGSSTYYGGYYGEFQNEVVIHGLAGVTVLQLAAQTGRLYAKSDKGNAQTLLRWGDELNVQWHWKELAGQRNDDDTQWWLQASLPVPQALLCRNTPPLYLDVTQGTCGVVTAPGLTPEQLLMLFKAPVLPRSVLEKHQDRLIQQLGPLPMPPVLPQVRTVRNVAPSAHLHLRRVPAAAVAVRGWLQAELRFDYVGLRGWWLDQPASVVLQQDGQRIRLERDVAAEQRFIDALVQLGLEYDAEGHFGIVGTHSQQPWLHWMSQGYAPLLATGCHITWDAELNDWLTPADGVVAQLQPQGDETEATSPWFDLSLGIDINGVRHNILPWLPELIATLGDAPLDPDTGEAVLPPWLYLRRSDDAGFVQVPTAALRPWLAALLELVNQQHDFDAEHLRLSRWDALRTQAALGQGVVWDGAQQLRTLMEQLQGQSALPVVPLPAGLRAELRPYQHHGLNWLQFLSAHGLGGILADDMGLGKTLQTLAHILLEKEAGRLTAPALVIAPVSLMGNWRREAARFCPDVRCLVLHGQDRHEAAASMAEHDLVIAPYSLLARDRDRWLGQQWHLVVLDEAQNIKNANTQAAQVVAELPARHRLCLSGTPMENHLGEIWSLFHFLMPGFLGSHKRFTELFRNPVEKHGNSERLAQLRARITPFMLRRTKALVAHELPPKIETLMRVELDGAQADLYETIRLGMEKTVRDALQSQGLAKSQITILDALLKLRQVCCDPRLLKLDAARQVHTSAKLEQLMELLPEMLEEGRRILLFSQFTSMLTLIEAELKKRKIPWVKLTGQSQKRDEIITRFTSGEVPLFLISLKAGGVGLNLPQADTVIHYDPWWNPAVENQATDRAHRIGQTQSVWVVKLVTQGTIEERIVDLQARKAALAENMYSGAATRTEPIFSENDLAELLKPLSA